MQEINYARQERSAWSSCQKEYKCSVCDGPVERPRLVCCECSDRELENGRWESYLDSDDITTYQGSAAKDSCGSKFLYTNNFYGFAGRIGKGYFAVLRR